MNFPILEEDNSILPHVLWTQESSVLHALCLDGCYGVVPAGERPAFRVSWSEGWGHSPFYLDVVLLIHTARHPELLWFPASLLCRNENEGWTWGQLPRVCEGCSPVSPPSPSFTAHVCRTQASVHRVLSIWCAPLSAAGFGGSIHLGSGWQCDWEILLGKTPLLIFVNIQVFPALSPKQINWRVIYWNYHEQLHQLEPWKYNWNILKLKETGWFFLSVNLLLVNRVLIFWSSGWSNKEPSQLR